MKIAIIGTSGHGKSVLAEAIKQLSSIQCEVLTTQELLNIKKEEKNKLDSMLCDISELNTDSLYEPKGNIRKKGKPVKSWQRTKFYQK